MLGVARVLRGASVTNLLGDADLSPEQERHLRSRFVRRALDMLQLDAADKQLTFSLTGSEIGG